MKMTYDVEGMHCASCVHLIEQKVKKVPGVADVSVHLATEKAEVVFADSVVPTQELNRVIQDFGYTLQEKTVHEPHTQTNTSPHAMMHDHSAPMQELRYILPMVAISFFMMGWEFLGRLHVLPEVPEVWATFFHHLMPIMATFVLFGVGRKYLTAVWTFVKTGTANMDTLVGVSTTIAFLYSFIITAFEGVLAPYVDVKTSFYDVVIVVIGLIAYGQSLEQRSKKKTGEALRQLTELTSKQATVLRDGKEYVVPIEALKVADIVVVKPHERIPADGTIQEGTSSIDEATITGESIPVDKQQGDTVFAGTQNLQGLLHISVTQDASHSTLQRIIEIVEAAQNSKAPIERLADKISGVFVYVVLVIALITLLTWIVAGPAGLGLTKALALALSCSMAVLVAACPCSLGLATPTALITAIGRAAGKGILIKNAEALEKLGQVDTVVFDKTGTLSENKLAIQSIDYSSEEALLPRILYTLARSSQHPISQSIATYLNDQETVHLTHIHEVAGRGMEGTHENTIYRLGSRAFVQGKTKVQDSTKQSDVTRVLYLSSNHEIIATIHYADILKPEAASAVAKLQRLGILPVMATGDIAAIGNEVAKTVGMSDVHTGIQPEKKLTIIQTYQQQGKRVAMVGDGVNDAPALAGADVAISLSDGSDVAIESADIILLHGDIGKIADAIDLAKQTKRIIVQNLSMSFAYNALMIPLAAGILYPFNGFTLSPAIAGAIMAFESLSVVTNSLRLKKA